MYFQHQIEENYRRSINQASTQIDLNSSPENAVVSGPATEAPLSVAACPTSTTSSDRMQIETFQVHVIHGTSISRFEVHKTATSGTLAEMWCRLSMFHPDSVSLVYRDMVMLTNSLLLNAGVQENSAIHAYTSIPQPRTPTRIVTKAKQRTKLRRSNPHSTSSPLF